MADANLRTADPRNYQLPGRVSVWFRKTGSSDVKDWKDLGNIIDPAINATIERLEHFSQRRGARAKDRTLISERSATLNFSIDEINRHNLQFAFGQTEEGTSDTFIVNENKTLTNPGAGQDLDLGDVDISNVVVRTIELEGTPTVFASGTDYTMDFTTGILTVSGSGALASGGAPDEIHVFYQKSVETESFEIFDGATVEGEAKFQILTPEGIKVAFEFQNVNLINNGDISIGDGTAFQQVPLSMEILVDDNGQLGTCHVVNDGEL